MNPRTTNILQVLLSTLLALSYFAAQDARAQELTDGQVFLISTRLAEGAQRSWELGARAQAALELNATRYSVYSKAGLPPPQRVPSDMALGLEPVFNIARRVLDQRPGGSDPRPLISDSSSADPASLGIAVVLANWTNLDNNADRYASAATSQAEYLFSTQVPKSDTGAISHRGAEVQIWSDSTFMVPPFLAYYGVITRNQDIVREAFNQVRLYRDHLRDGDTGLWKHSVLGNNSDPGLWATGNGWAAAGMLRVFATIEHSEYKDGLGSELNELKNWVNEIHRGVYDRFFDGENLVHNYLNDDRTFRDAAATALIASTVYRASTLYDEHRYIPQAQRSRLTLFTPNGGPGSNSDGSRFNDYEYFTTDGWLRPVSNPASVGDALDNGRSPEAQAFAVMLHAAWKDWVFEGEKGKDGASSALGLRVGAAGAWALAVLAGIAVLV
ncbi:Six-hairpin glycosidase [Coprinopsis marcescibilis]|uniref:Six-hairpin glycosidase n=1 Tax=Coprinopsis marcescibilis TaxID=230819 RepID=A0A5C3KVJ2_COPMA|nr:Six-hairpin glycosidase [Coprinopsis marcescibilis]